MQKDKCINCKKDGSERNFPWECRPRFKDLARGHVTEHTTLEVDLCDECYNKAKDNLGDRSLVGWDWWDSVDSLCYGYIAGRLHG